MANPLIPTQTGDVINVPALLNSPARLTDLIAKLTAERLLLDKFFTTGGVVAGGGVLHTVLTSANQYLAGNPEERSPGAEYVILRGDELRELATVQDWGAKVELLDEEELRNDSVSLANKLIQLANSIARKLDQAALAAIEASLTRNSVASVSGHSWSSLVTVGDPATLTASALLPTADFANTQLAADLEDVGVTFDTLVLHPNQHAALKIAYADKLAAVLASAGLTVFSSNLVTAGTAYAVQKGQAGKVAFETPLKVETIDKRENRLKWLQSYVTPAFAVSRPGAVRKITGLAG
ncbi:hypothetical protein P3H15_11290 [Rhodococcus sp. T2V]|uniref:major capsid protein n=1 Tax=Rhodococcus sp. T2V TaxID=3034164 RepID=UPI0023E13588|nr:major capsid protein [Rhodococcus sp. T2V]MDF3305604.1 hypothetical protein [Rhodococcus sp. T2V]